MARHYQSQIPAADLFWRDRPTLAPLKDAAAAVGLGFGLASTYGRLSSQPKMRDLVERECSVFANTGNMLMGPIHPSENTYDYVGPDWVIDWCAARGISSVQGGHLLYHQQLPAWLAAITDPTASRAAIESHISNVMGHCGPRGQTHWNVVNEVINADIPANGFRNNYFYQVHGTSYPTWAFQAARAARPTDTLIWASNHIEDNDGQLGNVVRQKHYEAIDAALQAGATIDGFGTQMHLHVGNGANNLAASGVVVDWLNTIATDFGLDIYITELDIGDSIFTAANRAQGVYDVVLDYVGSVCRDVPALRHIVCWGVMHPDSWLITEQPRSDGLAVSPLPFTGQGYPAPMAQALLDSFALRTPV